MAISPGFLKRGMIRAGAAVLLALLASSTVNAADKAATPETPMATENPLLTKSSLPFEYPPFDKIRNEHFAPALDAAMAEHLREIDAIARNPEPASFENTIVAMERSGIRLARVLSIFSSLTNANTNNALDKIDSEYSPKIAAHGDAIVLNSALYARVAAVYDARETIKLDPESRHLLERYRRDFVRAGAALDENAKVRLREINGEVATLQTKFGQFVLKETNDGGVWVETKEELDGLDEGEIAAAATAAKAAGKEGKYLLRLMNTSGQPAMVALKNRDLRARIHRVSLERGSHGGPSDTREILARLARLRAERAALLGYENHAAYVLEDETAGTVKAVNDLLGSLAPAAVANARKESVELQKVIDEEKGGFSLAASDWSHYSEKLRRAKYSFDESQLKPYFEVNHVLIDGVFFAARKFYGVNFKERHDLPVYEPSVRVFDVFNEDGSRLGIYLCDLYARPAKRGGAWMNSYVDQTTLLGTVPIVANHLNVPVPPAGEPTLMTWDEVNTLFHEFGHALHGLFSNVKYPRFSGTNVPRDFVEYPSQVNEMWGTWPEVVAHYARHYKTGEPMPQELLNKMLATQKFNQGFATTEYLAAALLDQGWHQLKASEVPGTDEVLQFEAATLKRYGVDYPPVPPRYRSAYFNHIFAGGYSSGYYAYIWSEVLDAQSVEWIKAHGGLTRKNGDHFRQTLLSRGGSADAMKLFHDFSGAKPDIEPLLERRGLK